MKKIIIKIGSLIIFFIIILVDEKLNRALDIDYNVMFKKNSRV